MRAIGYLLLAAGFLGSAFLAVRSAENVVPWGWFAPTLIVAIVGVVIARMSIHQETRAEGALAANVGVMQSSIDRVVENIIRLDGEKERLNPYDVHGRIDALFPEDLTRFADARGSVAHVYGLQAYAELMNEFAAGERYLNRVWSASVDGYIDEVREYLGRAREQFTRTQEILARLQSATPR